MLKNYNIEAETLLVKLFIFIISPFLSFLISLRNASSRSSYVIYALFGIVFCWHMNPTGVGRYDDLNGIMYYIINFDSMSGFSSLAQELKAYFTFSENSPKELYLDVLIRFSRLFTDNPHFVFALAAIPYLYFMLKALRLITNDAKFINGNILCLIIIFLFVFQRDIITVQNPRFTTALWMSVYSTIMFFNGQSKFKYVILLCLTPLVHSAFWVYLIIFMLGAVVFMRSQRLSIILLYASIPFSYLSYDILSSFNFEVLSLPTIFERWIENYLSEEKFNSHILHEGASGFFWVQSLFTTLQNTALVIIPIMLWRERSFINSKPELKNLFSFYLYFYAFVNFIQFVPVLGQRFSWISAIFTLYLFFKVFGITKRKYILFLLFSFSYSILRRYFYGGAVSSVVPLEIFYMPLPYLILDYVGISPQDMKDILLMPDV